ncbi:hypothetical protein [Bacillus sp. B-jedd]|uniref:hypothetical protein n=1 Tax=Bacillus sp. B-jedd TaxID=1476857 RepID=UPI0005156CE0|nr:hypothetical protein [Bacillus sp. B-jedd]CEG27073.1 hypothetical protein BN1002_01929 [Bacillus sp. B-jedd]
MKKKWYLIIGIAIIIFFSIKYYDDHREKGLDDLISYKLTQFESLSIHEGPDRPYWTTEKREHAEKFQDFLSQYRVKRMKDFEWNSDVSKEKGFQVTIYVKGKPLIASIYETRLLFLNKGKYYKVINGPVDMEWVNDFVRENPQ